LGERVRDTGGSEPEWRRTLRLAVEARRATATSKG